MLFYHALVIVRQPLLHFCKHLLPIAQGVTKPRCNLLPRHFFHIFLELFAEAQFRVLFVLQDKRAHSGALGWQHPHCSCHIWQCFPPA